jgi:hypothetical protein
MEPWLKQPLDLTGRLHRHCVGLATGESSGYSVRAPPGPRAGPGLRVSGSSGPGPGRGSVARLGQRHCRSVAVAGAGGFRGSAAACAAARWRPQSRPRLSHGPVGGRGRSSLALRQAAGEAEPCTLRLPLSGMGGTMPGRLPEPRVRSLPVRLAGRLGESESRRSHPSKWHFPSRTDSEYGICAL